MLKISGSAGRLTTLGIKPGSNLITTNNIPLRNEHTTGNLGVLIVTEANDELLYSGYVYPGNEEFVKKFKHVSAAIMLGNEVHQVTEISLTFFPRKANTTLILTEETNMAKDFQEKPYPSFAQQPSVAGDSRLATADYDAGGFNTFNDEHLNFTGPDPLAGGEA